VVAALDDGLGDVGVGSGYARHCLDALRTIDGR